MLIKRRGFLGTSGLAIATASIAGRSLADDRPVVTNPRATDGDDTFEPAWEQKFQVTVGRQNADLNGQDDRVLQAAVDYVARAGGGTVKILPGVYTLRAAVVLPSGIRLVGSGLESIITRIPSETVSLAADSDWYDQEVTLTKPGNFRVGDSVVLQAKNPDTQAAIFTNQSRVSLWVYFWIASRSS